ncbi:MAG: ABC transporter substrate-binding protein [Rhodospirillaceae bacterium]|jgi:NitT/TauT family transport system substrate-binding protein|nr:ABC transporter substrate-binding protein [Rhodospirillaceae bacterium]MBT5456745.1 ABC transporter substrate-binding protein [Rhodospirillaceae bacterium]
MSKFTIQPHGRLNDWVAEELGYFKDEGLDYFLNVDASYKSVPQLAEALETGAPIKDNLFGAFERYAEGHGRKGGREDAGDVSCACHWTVNQSAKLQDGIMYGRAYSVCEAAIVVPGDSPVMDPRDLAGVEVAVGYHSGSHYSALQALEVFLEPEDIALKFVGTSWSRVDAAYAGKLPAVNVWGAQLYLLEQLGFRRIVSTTFMMGYMFPVDANADDVEKYMRALIRAQADIDATPEKFKHYFLNEIPDRYCDKVDVRRFGPGERVVPQPYTEAMFEQTQAWMHERNLFEVGAEDGVSYAEAVLS